MGCSQTQCFMQIELPLELLAEWIHLFNVFSWQMTFHGPRSSCREIVLKIYQVSKSSGG